jgi:5-methylcytosine-specific restriction endonuclease McrA
MSFEYSLSVPQHYYEKVRPFILKRDNHKCVICGKVSRIVHHIDGNTLNSKFSNLVVVCKKHHSHKEEFREIFAKIVKDREKIMQEILRKIPPWR